MGTDWESLLDELWSYAASDPIELESKMRSCLNGHSSEGLLQAISLLLAQGQQAASRTLLSEFLKNHHAAEDIQRRLELILNFKKNRAPQMLSIKSKQRDKEALLKEVNDLVASGKLLAAEYLLLEAIEANEEPDCLNLLSRVYMRQRRPIDGARAMQRARLLKRHQQAFLEAPPDESGLNDLPTDSDLVFLNNSAELLTTLEKPTVSGNNALVGVVDESLNFIQHTASQYPQLNSDSDGWWEGQSGSTSSEASICVDEPETTDVHDASPAATGNSSEAHELMDEAAPSATKKTILKLAHPRKSTAIGEGLTIVKVFNTSGRSLSVVQPATPPEPTDNSPSQPTPSPSLEVSTSTPEMQDEVVDENDEDDEGDEYLSHTDLELDSPASPRLNSGLEYPEDDFDLDNDLYDLTIIELGAGHEEGRNVLDDFRDLDDDYAAYAFDPDEVFDSEDAVAAEPTDWFSDKLSREDRALQKAAELIGSANWPLSTLPLIQQIFIMSGWGATRLALEREIEKGLTPEELILAAHIKVIWAENDIYWIAFDKTGSSRLSYYVLSWPTALLIVRSFESLPQVEEIEVFIEGLFASWYENTVLRRVFKAFARYLWFRFANLEGCLPANQHFDFCDPRELPAEEYSDLGLCDMLEIEKTEILRAYGVFKTKHPQEPDCYFSDKPPVVIQEPNLNASTGKGKRSKTQPESADPLTEIESDNESIDDGADEAPPQCSAPPLTSALHTHGTDQTWPSNEP